MWVTRSQPGRSGPGAPYHRPMARRVALRAPAILALLLVACGAPPEVPEQPNIVLIISDDHGYPDYGFMGSPAVRTPHLDRLAAEGVAFTQGYSTASVCRPALATLLTGLLPIQMHFWERKRMRARRSVPFVTELETLPRLLAARGYASFQAGKHWEGSARDGGFDEGMIDPAFEVPVNEQWHELLRKTVTPVSQFLARHRDRPFLLWYAPLVPHLPHDAPKRHRAIYADAPRPERDYYAAISWLDEDVGRLVEEVRGLGLERRTLFVYLADNGWDVGRSEYLGAMLGGPQGKMSLHGLGLRTPVIFRWLGGVEPGPLRSELVSFTDVFATLVDYGGAAMPPGREGRSLRPLLEGRGTWERAEVAGWMSRLRGQKGLPEHERGGFFWRDLRWHYTRMASGLEALYDLAADPHERRDVASEHPETVARLRDRVADWIKELDLDGRSRAARP